MFNPEIRKRIFGNKLIGSMKSRFFPIAIILIGILATIRMILNKIINICNKIQKSLSKVFINKIL